MPKDLLDGIEATSPVAAGNPIGTHIDGPAGFEVQQDGDGGLNDTILQRRYSGKIRTTLDAISRSKRSEQMREAIIFGTNGSAGSVFGTRGERDVQDDDHAELTRMAYHLANTNPLAHATTELLVDFVVGTGFEFSVGPEESEALVERVKEIIKEFWENPVNDFRLSLEQKIRELSMYGEQCYPAVVDPVTGRVTLGYIDPVDIEEVIFLPGDSTVIDELVVTRRLENGQLAPQKLKVIRENEKGLLEGEVFFFTINRATNAARGLPDLLSGMDWADMYDQFLFNFTERYLMQATIVWDVEYKGLDDESLKEKRQEFSSAPKPGSIRLHNENVTWTPKGPPGGGSADAKELAELIEHYFLTSMRTPRHFLVDGGEVNFATAKEMGSPVFKRLVRRQNVAVSMVKLILRFALEQAHLVGGDAFLTREELDAAEVDVIPSQISVRDLAIASSALKGLGEALALAQTMKWAPPEDLARLFADEAKKLEFDLEFNEEFFKQKREEDEARQVRMEELPPSNQFPAELEADNEMDREIDDIRNQMAVGEGQKRLLRLRKEVDEALNGRYASASTGTTS